MRPELNEQSQEVVRRLKELSGPPAHAQTPESGRRGFQDRAGELGTDPEIDTTTEFAIVGPGGGDLPIRLYAHGDGDERPVLLWFHGGGWVRGDLDTHDHVCRELARETGWLVLSVGYRLAPEAPFPAALDDAYTATRWAGQHAGSVGGDPDQLVVIGGSAGGNLAASIALRARDEGLDLSGQALLYPVLDPSGETESYREFADGPLLTAEAMTWYWEQYLVHQIDGRHPYAAPARARSLDGVAPAIVLTCEVDILRDEGRAYADRLASAGVPVERLHYDGVMHGFLTTSGVVDKAATAHEDLATALDCLVS